MKFYKFFLLLIYTFQIVSTEENQILYRCGVDDNEVISVPIELISPEGIDKRKLTDDFGDFHIYLDFENIKNTLAKYNLEEYEEILIDSMNKAVKTLEALLKVLKINYQHTITDEFLKSLQINYWNASMIGSQVTLGPLKNGIDLVILAKFEEAMGDTTLARAGARSHLNITGGEGNGLPVVGLVEISTKLDFTKILLS